MPEAFVTGATGFLGQHLVLQLIEQGWAVRALKRPGSPLGALAEAQIDWIEGDLCDGNSIRAALSTDCDAVFHTAADTSLWRGDRDRQTRVNVQGTASLLQAFEAGDSGCFVYTSSIAVWGLQSGSINERSPRHDASVQRINYARTKSLAEDLARETAGRGRRVLIMNPAHIMGPLDRHNWIRLVQAVARRRLPGIAPGSGSFADVREVARAHIRAVENGDSGENYLLGGENKSFPEVIHAISEHLGVPVRAPQVPGPGLRAVARLKDWGSHISGRQPDITPDEAAFVSLRQSCDSSRAVEVLDYRLAPFDTLLAATLDWATKEGML